MNWDTAELVNQQDEKKVAQTPVIVTACRSTDIPIAHRKGKSYSKL